MKYLLITFTAFIYMLSSASSKILNNEQKKLVYGAAFGFVNKPIYRNGNIRVPLLQSALSYSQKFDFQDKVKKDLFFAEYLHQLFKLIQTDDNETRLIIQQKLEYLSVLFGDIPNLEKSKGYFNLPDDSYQPVLKAFRQVAGNLRYLDKEHKTVGFPKIPFLSNDDIDNLIFNNFKVTNTQAIELLKESLEKDKMPPVLYDFFQMVLDQYFNKIHQKYRARYITGTIYASMRPSALEKIEDPFYQTLIDLKTYNKDTKYPFRVLNEPEKIGVYLQNSGPALQKLFQLISSYLKEETIQQKMIKQQIEELKENVSPFSNRKAQNIVNQLFEDVIFDVPVGQATVGQVYITDTLDGTPLVFKIKRPGIDEFANFEMKILKEFSVDPLFNNTAIRAVIDDLEANLEDELKFDKEFSNLDLAVDKGWYHSPKERLYTVSNQQLTKEEAGKYEFLVMNVAPGRSVSTFLKSYNQFFKEFFGIIGEANPHVNQKYTRLSRQNQLRLNRQVCHDINEISKRYESLVMYWLFNGIFGTGHIHADAHPGNVFFDGFNMPKFLELTKNTGNEFEKNMDDFFEQYRFTPFTESNEGLPSHELFLIDFGSMPQITYTEGKGIVNLIVSLGLYKENPKKYAKQLYKKMALIVRNEAQIEKLKNKIVRKRIIEHFKTLNGAKYKSPGQLFKEVLQVLLTHNIDYTKGLTQFSRGHTMLEQTYAQIKRLKEAANTAFNSNVFYRIGITASESCTALQPPSLFGNKTTWDFNVAWRRTIRDGIAKYGHMDDSSFKSILGFLSGNGISEIELERKDDQIKENNLVYKKMLKKMQTKKSFH